MKNAAVINGIGLRAPASRPLLDGKSAFDRALEFARSLPGVSEPLLLLSAPRAGVSGCRVSMRESWSVADVLAEMARAAEGCEDIFYFFADCPFLDAGICSRMYENHRRSWADYSFADGFPAGLAPEILKRETVPRLRNLAGDGSGAPDRQTVFTLIKKDINSFDIETEISSTDQRMLRVVIAADTERDFRLLERIVAHGGCDATSVCSALQEHPEMLRTLPAFFPVQIVERCPHACAYCPYPGFGGNVLEKAGEMPADRFAALASKIAAFVGDAVIDISLWGEPALHRGILDIVASVLSEPGLELVIETSGVGWQPGMIQRIRDSFHREPTWIVSLDASNDRLYRTLRGDGFAEAEKTAHQLLALFPATAWVQAVRMKENEEDLEVFYKAWKARTENVIIQKYDSFHGTLPDRSVVDLSPTKRFPCWHLKRDLAVRLDGAVPLCREDLGVETRLGNAFSEDLAVIWDRAERVYRSHLAGEWPGICSGCDEYYTYNF
jgi:spiro-SPASM protein